MGSHLPQPDRGILGDEEKAQYGIKGLNDSSDTQTPAFRQTSDSDDAVGEVRRVNSDLLRQKELEGEANFRRLGWKRLTIVLIVEAVALGSLSLPGAFADLGMVAGVICSISLGMIAMYASYVVGQMKLKFPEISHYADAGRLMFGKWGYEIFGAMFTMQLIFIVGSHVLTGKIMWDNITAGGNGTCSIVFSVVSAIILFLVAIPPSFAEVAILGYIDFVSIIAAILITMVATGIQASHADGGLAAVEWSAWPREDISVARAFIAICNIVFAYSFALCQFSFMDEMHTPADFPKSILTLGTLEIVLYTITGAVIYAFVGPSVASPALLSAGPTVSKIAFGVALPVIFISGSINTVVVGRYLHGRMFRNSVIRYVNTPMGWGTWLALDAVVTVIAWVVAEAIPFFSDLLAISSSLFISGFTFYLPSIMWFMFIKEGKWSDRHNWLYTFLNVLCFVIGIIVLVVGTYSSIVDIVSCPHAFCGRSRANRIHRWTGTRRATSPRPTAAPSPATERGHDFLLDTLFLWVMVKRLMKCGANMGAGVTCRTWLAVGSFCNSASGGNTIVIFFLVAFKPRRLKRVSRGYPFTGTDERRRWVCWEHFVHLFCVLARRGLGDGFIRYRAEVLYIRGSDSRTSGFE